MKKNSALALRIFLVLLGAAALAFLLWEPHLEGRNAQATLFEIYFKDPFLAYAYIASIPFFAALWQAFKMLGYARQDKLLPEMTVKALRIIKYCAIAIIVFVAGGEIFIILSDSDDRAGGVVMGLLIAFGATLVAAAAARVERLVRNGANGAK
jgi:uncharacterized membrane protein (DUF106 family)